MFTTTSKSEDDYYDGPPPPDEIQSNKPKLPSNRVTPVKDKTDKVDADPLPDSVQSFQTLASTSGSINPFGTDSKNIKKSHMCQYYVI